MAKDESNRYTQIGIATLLPGMRHMLLLMQEEVQRLEALDIALVDQPQKKIDQPHKRNISLEGRQRIAKAQRDRWAKHHKAAEQKKASKGAKRRWAKMSSEKRAEWIQKMQQGKRKSATNGAPVVNEVALVNEAVAPAENQESK